jgi:hypothetical protein
MAPPRTVRAIYDTSEGVVHVPDIQSYNQAGIENIDEFVAWLNTKAKQQRFTVITATSMSRTARGGMTRRYADYLYGQPEVRIRAALNRLVEDAARYHGTRSPISLVRQGGGWEVLRAIDSIRTIADEANVPFNDARVALLAFLRRELGEVRDRVTFPPDDAVRPDVDSHDHVGHEAYSVNL